MDAVKVRDGVERYFLDMRGLEEFTCMHKSWLWPRVVSGEIPSVKLGARRLFPLEQVREWAERQCTEQAGSTGARD
jgi:predicted DNA-binding transcriptional regulator AlpA